MLAFTVLLFSVGTALLTCHYGGLGGLENGPDAPRHHNGTNVIDFLGVAGLNENSWRLFFF